MSLAELQDQALTAEEAMFADAMEALARGRRFPLRPEDVDLLQWIVRGYFHEA